ALFRKVVRSRCYCVQDCGASEASSGKTSAASSRATQPNPNWISVTPQRMSERQQPVSGTLSKAASGHMPLLKPVASGARHFLVCGAWMPHAASAVQQKSPTGEQVVLPHVQPSSTMSSQSLSLLSPHVSCASQHFSVPRSTQPAGPSSQSAVIPAAIACMSPQLPPESVVMLKVESAGTSKQNGLSALTAPL